MRNLEYLNAEDEGTLAGFETAVDLALLDPKTEVCVLRGDAVLFDGGVTSLKRFTEDVKEVRQGFECGIALSNFKDFAEGDVIEFYLKERVR